MCKYLSISLEISIYLLCSQPYLRLQLSTQVLNLVLQNSEGRKQLSKATARCGTAIKSANAAGEGGCTAGSAALIRALLFWDRF